MRQIRFNRSLTKYNYAEEFAWLARQPQTHAIVKMRDDLLYDIHMRGYPRDFVFRPEFSRDIVLREIYSQKAYNPAQPRLPRGQPGAGEWVGDNSGRTRLALGPQMHNPAVRDDAHHDVQYNRQTGRQANQPALPYVGGIQSAITLFNTLNRQSYAGEQPVIEFHSREYAGDGTAEANLAMIRSLTQAETLEACPRLAEVQTRVDTTTEEVRRNFPLFSPQLQGTIIHVQVAGQINGQRNTDFIAEKSYIKSEENSYYGQRGSIRVDALEEVNRNIVCVYDIKTGKAGLSHARYTEIATTVATKFPGVTRFIVTEVRPRR